jgi:hypothetical protein
MSFFGACTGTNHDGTGFSLGHDDTNHPPGTLSLSLLGAAMVAMIGLGALRKAA